MTLSGSVLSILGPIGQLYSNSRYFSGVRPTRLTRSHAGGLPHVTIQMPVYKEGLQAVIVPTIRSIKTAISTYEMQGGSANIFINDDGLQVIDEAARIARQDFYDEHNIGWVARPPHNPDATEGPPFVRRGKFKKASNMNYAFWVSTRVEDRLSAINRREGWTNTDELAAYEDALATVLFEDEGRTWARGK